MTMRILPTIISGMAVFITALAEAQSPLPLSVQADVLNNKIVGALKVGNTKEALQGLDEYHKLEAQGIPVPSPLLYEEAILAKSSGNLLRAYDTLESYLKKADRSDRHYAEAVRLYPELENSKVVRARAVEKANSDLASAQKDLDSKKKECQGLQGDLESSHEDLISCLDGHGYSKEMCRTERTDRDNRRYSAERCFSEKKAFEVKVEALQSIVDGK